MNIPQLDLANFLQEDDSIRKQFIQDLGSAFENVGFVAVVNHGISQSLIDSVYKDVEVFFSLPDSSKKSYEIANLAGQRGYTSFGREHAKGSLAPDLKEFFQYGQPSSSNLVKSDYPDNVFVTDIDTFNANLDAAFRSFEQAGSYLLEAIATHLSLDQSFFSEHIKEGNSILRAIHYPPILQEPSSSIRAEQHEDINLITLLVGASADGLEILSKDNQWLPVKAGPGAIVVNVGDMLQRLTNNKLKSTTHRVVNPPRELWSTSRYSIPFFLHPKSNMSLACLPSCVSDNSPKAYVDYTAGQYLDERLREIGLKN
jgi:isopenicillin N synthase-like dioxygenase